MLQFSKLVSILSFMIMLYSIYMMRTEEDIVFYIGTLIASVSVLILSVGILGISMINKKS